ncbi:MAG TPA: protein kinase, partial [Gemmatales bacterium]|nr:protein kinase [Gemmatales bacterium]
MPRAYQQGDEPVRGYRLGKFLGKGGFGDVWQAHGPGGTEVAFKIIRLDDKPGFTNLRTVELLKKIKHPNLCPILALWISDFSTTSASGILKKKELSGVGNNDKSSTHTLGEFNLDDLKPTAETLFIAMGLGDKSLLERFTECKDKGEQGIPSVELISYIEDAARAIDHLNAPKHDLGKGLQTLPHGDIKPQNILIVGGAAQVCDAGLRHVLGEMDRGAAGMTVAFSSPEMLDGGKPSPYSDQYSLAITYHYLRTGALPFSMNDANVVLTEALEGRLDLSRLSTAEQQVIRRAVSRRPEARFANCQDLARELRRAIERTGSGPT